MVAVGAAAIPNELPAEQGGSIPRRTAGTQASMPVSGVERVRHWPHRVGAKCCFKRQSQWRKIAVQHVRRLRASDPGRSWKQNFRGHINQLVRRLGSTAISGDAGHGQCAFGVVQDDRCARRAGADRAENSALSAEAAYLLRRGCCCSGGSSSGLLRVMVVMLLVVHRRRGRISGGLRDFRSRSGRSRLRRSGRLGEGHGSDG